MLAGARTTLFAALTACVLAMAPAIAAAQRGTAGGMGRGARLPGLVREPGIVVPKMVNAVNLLIQHSAELALSDSQFKQIIVVKRTLDSTNAPLLRRLDSLARLFRGGPIFSQPSRERLDSIAEGRAFARQVAAEVRETNESFRDKAYAVLNSQQLTRIRSLEAQAEQAIADEEKKRKP